MTAEAISPEVQGWFRSERGILPITLNAWGVHTRDDGAVILPYSNGEKTRLGIPTGDRKFFFTAGQRPSLFYRGADELHKVMFLVEGETDTMRLWQALESEDSPATVVGLSGIETWDDTMAKYFEDAAVVYVILDNDVDYNVQGRVDNTWKQIVNALGRRKAKRVRLPSDVKDICEFFTRYDLDTLRVLCEHKGPSVSRYNPIDLTAEPPPVTWLVDHLICKGDAHLLMGEPGIGKSWLTMSLAVAILEGGTWLGRDVLETGRVLYIDEENPIDLIHNRLWRLGLTPEGARNIRYLSNQGIRLDRNPEELIEEALDFEPTLIVLDSLTRFHTGDEDKAGSMAALYNDGLKPLARETGAALVLLHHANKTESNSSYRRSRGSGEIVANADSAFDVRQVGLGTLTVANFKSRRSQFGEVTNVAIVDTEDGGAKVVGGITVDPPF